MPLQLEENVGQANGTFDKVMNFGRVVIPRPTVIETVCSVLWTGCHTASHRDRDGVFMYFGRVVIPRPAIESSARLCY